MGAAATGALIIAVSLAVLVVGLLGLLWWGSREYDR